MSFVASCLTGGDLEFLLAAGGAVGLGEDELDLVARVDQGLEAGGRRIRGFRRRLVSWVTGRARALTQRARSRDAKFRKVRQAYQSPFFWSFLMRRRTRSRLRRLRAVDEEDAVEVVDLVEHRACQQLCTLYFKEFSFDILSTDF